MIRDDIITLQQDLAAGRTSAEKLVDEALTAAEDPAGQGSTAFVEIQADQARAEARIADQARAAGAPAGALAGIPISIKDLFDQAGKVTTAGSVALKSAKPAAKDAPAIARLRQAGAIVVGRTNMTEFAYSGLGLNPHYGTPLSPWNREVGHIPGGSTSGGAVSVADGMAAATIGSDTGGSCRIPAAFCGLVGFKPTQSRVPLTGALPLSGTLDSIGPLARTVADAALLDDIMSGGDGTSARPVRHDPRRIRLLRPENYVFNDMDEHVAGTMETALWTLADAGVGLIETTLPQLDEIPGLSANGGYTAAESFAWHQDLLARAEAEYDPRVNVRIKRGADISAADYIQLCQTRDRLLGELDQLLAGADAMVMPTVPVSPPRLSDLLEDDNAYHVTNLLCLRNPTVANFYNLPAITLPCNRPGTAPVGLMLIGRRHSDRTLFNIAATLAPLLNRSE